MSLRNLLLILTLIFLSQSVFAEKMDYSLCHDYFEKARKNSVITGYNFPFAIDKNGEIAFEVPGVDKFDYEEDMREYSWETDVPNKTKHKMIVTFNDHKQVVQVDYEQTNKFHKDVLETEPFLVDEFNSVVVFDDVDGKCFPSNGNAEQFFTYIKNPYRPQGTPAIREEGEKEATLFDTQLCYDIKKYFDNHPKLKSCFNGQSKENSEIMKLFTENGWDMRKIVQENGQFARDYYQSTAPYNYSVEQRMILANPHVAPRIASFDLKENDDLFKLVGDTPLLSAHRILMDCYDKGLGKTLADSSIFEEPLNINRNTNQDIKSGAEDSE